MEYRMKKVKIAAGVLLLLFFVWLVVTGQPSVGYAGLVRMLIGYAGVLVLLYLYNRPYSR